MTTFITIWSSFYFFVFTLTILCIDVTALQKVSQFSHKSHLYHTLGLFPIDCYVGGSSHLTNLDGHLPVCLTIWAHGQSILAKLFLALDQ